MKTNKGTVILSTHCLFNKHGEDIYGTGSAIADYLKEKKINYVYIKHPIYGGFPTVIYTYFNETHRSLKMKFKNSTLLPVKTLQEFLITMFVLLKQKNKADIFIGIDPLNAFFGIIAKKFAKVKRIIFYTADYTPKRFDNKIFNEMYHRLDRWVLTKVDQIWNVSSRITKLRKKQGVNQQKNYFVPNSPPFYRIHRLSPEKINRHELVLVSTSAQSTDFKAVFTALKKLSYKYPDIKLTIIGLDNWNSIFDNELNELQLKDYISFYGRLDHQNLLKIFCHAALGLALYTTKFSWTYYSDSMKARDYLACGLPVIMTDISSTSDDIKKAKAGLIIKLTTENLVKAIDYLFSHKTNYQLFRANAIKLAEKYDIFTILERRMNFLTAKPYKYA